MRHSNKSPDTDVHIDSEPNPTFSLTNVILGVSGGIGDRSTIFPVSNSYSDHMGKDEKIELTDFTQGEIERDFNEPPQGNYVAVFDPQREAHTAPMTEDGNIRTALRLIFFSNRDEDPELVTPDHHLVVPAVSLAC